MRAYVTAGQRSRCGWCDEDIQIGEPITLIDDEWCHAACEDEADELDTGCMRTGTCDRCGSPFVDTSLSRNRRWCSENCRKRAGDDRSRAACADCGALLGPRSGWLRPGRTQSRCWPCEAARRNIGHTAHLLGIYLLWEQGWTASRIAERIGSTPASVANEVSTMRTAGVALEVRRPDAQDPEHLARLHAGRDAWRAAA